VELYLHPSNTPSWCGAQLKKYEDNFTFLTPGGTAPVSTGNEIGCGTQSRSGCRGVFAEN